MTLQLVYGIYLNKVVTIIKAEVLSKLVKNLSLRKVHSWASQLTIPNNTFIFNSSIIIHQIKQSNHLL